MIAAACFMLLAVLALRSLVLLALERKPLLVRAADLFFAVLFALFAAFLLFFAGLRFPVGVLVLAALFLIAALPSALVVRHRLCRPYRHRPVFFLFKAVLALIVFCVTFVAVMTSGFLYLTQDEPVAKVVMTGRKTQEPVEWKPPDDRLQRQNLDAYEVLVQTPEGQPIQRFFVYGDQVAIKARVIRFRPILNAAGFHNLCAIDYLYNGYTTAARFNFYPHRAQEIKPAHPALAGFQRSFWDFWGRLYYREDRISWVKSATLESQYFPLVRPDGSPFQGAYFLTITSGGLSAVPLP